MPKTEMYLLWREVKGYSSQIHFHKGVSTWQNKEKSWKEKKVWFLNIVDEAFFIRHTSGMSKVI